MVPDVHPRKIVTFAWMDPWNWSLVLAKAALVCLFQNTLNSLHLLDVRLLAVSIDRGDLLPLLIWVGRVKRMVQRAVPQGLRPLRPLAMVGRLCLSSLLKHESTWRQSPLIHQALVESKERLQPLLLPPLVLLLFPLLLSLRCEVVILPSFFSACLKQCMNFEDFSVR